MNNDLAHIPPVAMKAIQERLAAAEGEHGVAVVYACESGSRAWAFPSQDSDYDVRFIYVHPAAWLQSPVHYRESPALAVLRDLMQPCYSPTAHAYHHLSLVKKVHDKIAGGDRRLKTCFYGLRSALTLRWIDTRPDLPPMALDALMAPLSLDDKLAVEIADLRAHKAATMEAEQSSCAAMLKHGEPVVEWHGADRQLLLDIRRGAFTYTQLLAMCEELQHECDTALEATTLPAQVNEREIDDLLFDTYETFWRGGEGRCPRLV